MDVSLEGYAIAVAEPSTGKNVTFAFNLFSPDCRILDGSTVAIHLRGELRCIAVRGPSTSKGGLTPNHASRSYAVGGLVMVDSLHLGERCSRSMKILSMLRSLLSIETGAPTICHWR